MSNFRLALATAASALAIFAMSPTDSGAADGDVRMAQGGPPAVNPNDVKADDPVEGKPDPYARKAKRDKGDRGQEKPANKQTPPAGKAAKAPNNAPNAKAPQIINPNSQKTNAPVESKPDPYARKAKRDKGDGAQERPAAVQTAPAGPTPAAPRIAPDANAPPKFSRPGKPQQDDRDNVKDARDSKDNGFNRQVGQDRRERPSGGVPGFSGPSPANATINDIKSSRKERREQGGKRLVIEEADSRTITQQDNRIAIDRDERDRMRRFNPNARIERGRGGNSISVFERGSVKIYSETDERGRLVRRYRRDGSGRETTIIDNRRRKRNVGRDVAIGAGIGAGVVAGAVLLDSLVRVPPPRVTIAREKYIVRGEGASDEDYYEALSAPPVDRYDDRYTLDEIRATPRLRERMRRIDLDDVTFAFGAWDIDPGQYHKLERLARGIKRVLRRDPDEVFLIEGHTDAVGSRIDNLTLSDRRAETVAYILTREFDVPFESLATQGYGEEYLKIVTEAPERINRRVAARRITPLLARDGDGPRADRGDEPPRYDRDGDDGRGGDDERYEDRGPGADRDAGGGPGDDRDYDGRGGEPYDDRGGRPPY